MQMILLKLLKSIILPALAGATIFTWSIFASANEYDWKPLPENLMGLDGVVIRCVVSSERKFVHQMCKSLIKSGLDKAAKRNLKATSTGITWERRPDDSYRAAVQAAEIKSPLLLEIFIRGTDGKTVSGSVNILASVIFQAAVEQGTQLQKLPRSGRLIIWESAGTASGDAKRLAPALANFMKKKLDLLFDHL